MSVESTTGLGNLIKIRLQKNMDLYAKSIFKNLMR